MTDPDRAALAAERQALLDMIAEQARLSAMPGGADEGEDGDADHG